eukprot:2099285-Amphidinium_carterae.1
MERCTRATFLDNLMTNGVPVVVLRALMPSSSTFQGLLDSHAVVMSESHFVSMSSSLSMKKRNKLSQASNTSFVTSVSLMSACLTPKVMFDNATSSRQSLT